MLRHHYYDWQYNNWQCYDIFPSEFYKKVSKYKIININSNKHFHQTRDAKRKPLNRAFNPVAGLFQCQGRNLDRVSRDALGEFWFG